MKMFGVAKAQWDGGFGVSSRQAANAGLFKELDCSLVSSNVPSVRGLFFVAVRAGMHARHVLVCTRYVQWSRRSFCLHEVCAVIAEKWHGLEVFYPSRDSTLARFASLAG